MTAGAITPESPSRGKRGVRRTTPVPMPELDLTPADGSRKGAQRMRAVDALLGMDALRVYPVPLDVLDPHPENLRDDVGDITEMAAEMAAGAGVLEPLLVASASAFWAARGVTDTVDAGRVVLLAGHRRAAAARQAGLGEVPCLVRDDLAGDRDAVVTMLLENLHREGLRPVEEARGYHLLEGHGLSQRDIATRVGCSQANVSKKLALLRLPVELRATVGERDGIAVADAVELAKYADDPELITAALTRPSWQSVEDAAEAMQEKRDRTRRLDEAKADWRAKGVTRFTTTFPSPWINSLADYMTRGGHGSIPVRMVNVEDHHTLACHAVALDVDYNGRLRAEPVCTKPATHAGDVQAKADRAEARKAREEAKAAEQAAARRELVRSVLAGKPTKDLTGLVDALLIADQLRGFNRDHEIATLATLLGMDTDGLTSRQCLEQAAALAEGSAAQRARLLAAVTLAHVELAVDTTWGDHDAAGAYLRWLQAQGHELAGVERKLVQKKAAR